LEEPAEQYLLRDEFLTGAAAPITSPRLAEPGPGEELTVDAENKIAIASNWLEWTAQATPVYAEQHLVYSTPVITREPGVMILCRWRCATDNPHYPLALVDSTTPTWNHTNVRHGFFRSAALSLARVDNQALGPVLASFVADGTIYYLLIALRATGAKYYIKGGAFTNWTFLDQSSVDSTTPLYVASAGYTAVFSTALYRDPLMKFLCSPFTSDGFSAAGVTDGLGHAEGVSGSLGSGGAGIVYLSGGTTWGISSGQAVNTPTQGNEMVTNGSFETDASGWTALNGATLLGGVPGGVSGNCLQVTRGTGQACGKQDITVEAGSWYRFVGNLKDGTGGARFRINCFDDVTTQFGPSATWLERKGAFRPPAGVTWATIQLEDSSANGTTVNFDEFSIKKLTLKELFNSIQSSTSNVFASVACTIANYFQGGMVLCLDSFTNPQNYITVYYNRALSKIFVDKRVAGALSNVLTVTATYASGAVLVCRKVGTSIYVFYNNALIGTATISDAQVINNTLHGLFSTGGPTEVQLDNFVVYPAGNEGQNDILNRWSN
jgi:hypothetical protein